MICLIHTFIYSVKRAYYKKSLKVHPDRVNEDEKENATEKFQTLSKVYSILGDQEKRRIYDETGKLDFSIKLTLIISIHLQDVLMTMTS